MKPKKPQQEMHEQFSIREIAEVFSDMVVTLKDLVGWAEAYLASCASDGNEPVIDPGKVESARTVLDRFNRTIK